MTPPPRNHGKHIFFLEIEIVITKTVNSESLKKICRQLLSTMNVLKRELQRENKLISYKRAFKMLENDICIAGIGQAVLELLTFKVGSRNRQRGISLPQKFSEIYGKMRLVSLKNDVSSDKSQFPKIKN